MQMEFVLKTSPFVCLWKSSCKT